MKLVYESELYHSAQRKNVKYIARVPIGNGKYRYFYTQEEYDAYRNGKKPKESKVKKISKSVPKFFKNIATKTSKLFKKSKKEIGDTLKKGRKFIDEVIFGKKSSKKKTQVGLKSIEKKIHKYTQKMKLPNGKYKYFYSDEEYERYLTRQKYQKKEPDFMKKVPKMSDDESYTSKEDMAEINEEYSPYDYERSRNCANCSIAYELRCRGYDVQAADRGTDKTYIGAQRDYVNEVYKDADTIYLNENGDRDKVQGALSKIGLSKRKGASYTPSVVEQSILKHSGKNTRGEIQVDWKSGGGHSMVYEVDNQGKVIIRDCQVNKVWPLETITSSVSRIAITRTDNLELKQGILECVEDN